MQNKNVLITGVTGFLGRRLEKHLAKENNILRGSRRILGETYLSNRENTVELINGWPELDYIFHCASYNGGLQFNRTYPADVFTENILCTINLLWAVAHCNRPNKPKVILPITSCAYPDTEDILVENMLLGNPPNQYVACHGYAKRNVQLAAKYYSQQYNVNAITVCPNMVMGPGDSVDLNRTKVPMAVIKKICDASKNNTAATFFGDGQVYRSFIYVDDAVKAMIKVADSDYADHDNTLNFPAHEILLSEYVKEVANYCEFKNSVLWDHSYPNGQLRKELNCSKFTTLFPDFKLTPLHEMVEKTAQWYQQQVQK